MTNSDKLAFLEQAIDHRKRTIAFLDGDPTTRAIHADMKHKLAVLEAIAHDYRALVAASE